MSLLRAGMAEMVIGAKGDRLQALGLGSCIGLIMVDPQIHVGGMVHVMLPNSSINRGEITQPGKFADTGVPLLLERMKNAGALKARLIVKMAGGAEMFTFAGTDSPKLAIGSRNADAVKEECDKLGLRIKASETGGSHGRTLEIDLNTLVFTVKVVGKGVQEF